MMLISCFSYWHETVVCETMSFLLEITIKNFALVLVSSDLVPVSPFFTMTSQQHAKLSLCLD